MNKYCIGEARKAAGEETRKRVKDWFFNNPFSNQKSCAEALGLTSLTVSKHVKSLKAEADKGSRKTKA